MGRIVAAKRRSAEGGFVHAIQFPHNFRVQNCKVGCESVCLLDGDGEQRWYRTVLSLHVLQPLWTRQLAGETELDADLRSAIRQVRAAGRRPECSFGLLAELQFSQRELLTACGLCLSAHAKDGGARLGRNLL